MGVFRKLKDVLFDIEEEEIPVITKEEKNVIVKEENPIKEIKIPKEENMVLEETIAKPKSESSFNFPIDFDDEIPVRSKKEYYTPKDDYEPRSSYRDVSREIRREEAPRRKDTPDYSKFLSREPSRKEESKPFKPSPVISPVYGILDQNYTKDDVIVKTDIGVKAPNLDEVRKKVYASKIKEEKKKEVIFDDEFTEPLKTLDEILIDKEDAKEEAVVKTKVKTVIEETAEIEPIKVFDDELPDEPYADEVMDEKIEDTLETDLFNLIDSMYEERNEREEEE